MSLDAAIRDVERELEQARTELRLAGQLEAIASAKYMGLLEELGCLCKAKQAAVTRTAARARDR